MTIVKSRLGSDPLMPLCPDSDEVGTSTAVALYTEGVVKGAPVFWIKENKCVYKIAQSRFASVVLGTGLGPPHQLPHLTVSLCLWSSGSNARVESRVLEGHRVRVQVSFWKEQKREAFPQ